MEEIKSLEEVILELCNKSKIKPVQCTIMSFSGADPFERAKIYRDAYSSNSPGENRLYGPFICSEGIVLIAVLNKV